MWDTRTSTSNTRTILIALLGLTSLPCLQAETSRDNKLLGVFTIVNFPNTACNVSSSNTVGVCYTPIECQALGGTASATCASGFGVCCTFSARCGETTSLNNTYFASRTSGDSSPCSLTVCRANTNICQIRLDFETFNIEGPVTSTTSAGGLNIDTVCNTATFTASSNKETNNVICGDNSGQHMILEADQNCNTLQFLWNSGTPSFNILWFTGTTGTIQSYNFAGGSHLAGQDYTACIREEAGYCSITYTADTFKISLGKDDTQPTPNVVNTHSATGSENCNLDTMSDYVMIPGGGPTSTVSPPVNNDVPNAVYFCGAVLAPAISPAPASGTNTAAAVSTSHKPFTIHFHTDYNEVTATAEDGNTDIGFSISYSQVAC